MRDCPLDARASASGHRPGTRWRSAPGGTQDTPAHQFQVKFFQDHEGENDVEFLLVDFKKK